MVKETVHRKDDQNFFVQFQFYFVYKPYRINSLVINENNIRESWALHYTNYYMSLSCHFYSTFETRSATHNSSTLSRDLIAASLTAIHLRWPRTTNSDKTYTRANPLYAPKCKPSPLVSKQDPHFPRPQPQIPTNGSKINIFIIQILPVDNISAFKNCTVIGYDWDDDGDELHIFLRSLKFKSKLKTVYP